MPEFRLEFVICINICIDTQLHTHALSIALIIFAEKNSKVNCKIICIDSATFKNSIPLSCLLFIPHALNLVTYFSLSIKHNLLITESLFFFILIVAIYPKYLLFEFKFNSLFCSFLNNNMHKQTNG